MNFLKNINKNNLTRKAYAIKFKLNKRSPEISLGIGILCGIATTVSACKATIKAQEILKERDENLKKYEELKDEGSDEYTEEDYDIDVRNEKIKSYVKIGKAYAQSVVFGVSSVFFLVNCDRTLNRRLAGVTSAYELLSDKFNSYRDNVVKKYGKDEDDKLYHNVESFIDENGEEHIPNVEQLKEVAENSVYSRFFDETCFGYRDDPEKNREYLMMKQKEANKLLELRGYLFLNDIYSMLDMPKSNAGQFIGYVYDPNNSNKIDFGITRNTWATRRFVNGYEPVILLDFNVDGIIDLEKYELKYKLQK